MKGRRGTLALRISLLAVAVSVLTAAIGGLIAVRLVRDADESGARQTLSRIADQVQADVVDTPDRAVTALRALKVDIGGIGRRGRVTGDSSLVDDSLTADEIDEVLTGGSVSAVQNVDGESVLVEARPVSTGGFVLVQPLSEALALNRLAIGRLILGLAIACVFAVLLGLLVAWRLGRPLRRTAQAARSLASGERAILVDPEGPAEVAEVALALNVLSSNLTHSEARQRDFLLSVSHDLRTPLTAIAGYAESLADGMIEAAEVPSAGAVILSEARRLNRFVADLLDLARLDAREVRIDPTNVEIGAVIEGAASAWQPRCDAESIPLKVERASYPLWVYTDPGRLRQVLDGLLENALRVVPTGRPIVLASRPEIGTDGVQVAVAEVRDGGPGLSDEDFSVAFDRAALYERYKGIRQVGTGLGLAIVKQLVARLGGTVEAGHAKEGGARFTVRLPLRPA